MYHIKKTSFQIPLYTIFSILCTPTVLYIKHYYLFIVCNQRQTYENKILRRRSIDLKLQLSGLQDENLLKSFMKES